MKMIFDMTISGTVAIIIVMAIRFLFRKQPKVFSYVLWMCVLLRLLCPVLPESDMSIFNLMEQNDRISVPSYDHAESYTPVEPDVITPAIGTETGLPADIEITYTDNTPIINISRTDNIMNAATEDVLFSIWVFGMGGMILYGVLSLSILRRKLRTCVNTHGNIYECDGIDSPFVLGVFSPKIYLPAGLSVEDSVYVIMHEKYHIKRFDHITKILFFVALSVHWFNPLVWLAFTLFSDDMEMSCDEAVISKADGNIKADYSAVLLSLSINKKSVSPAPVNFGDVNATGRIKNLAVLKKPAVIVSVILAVLVGLFSVMLITEPSDNDKMIYGGEYTPVKIIYGANISVDVIDEAKYLEARADMILSAARSLYIGEKVGSAEEYYLTKSELKGYAKKDSAWFGKLPSGEFTDSFIVRTGNDNFYMFFRTKQGRTFVAYGWEDVSERGEGASDDTLVEYIYEIAPTEFGEDFSGMSFDRSVREYTGSEIYRDTYRNPKEDEDVLLYTFRTDTSYGLATFLLHDEGRTFSMISVNVFETMAAVDKSVYFCDKPVALNLTGDIAAEEAYYVIFTGNYPVTARVSLRDGENLIQKEYHDHGIILIPLKDLEGKELVTIEYYDLSGNEIDISGHACRYLAPHASATVDSLPEYHFNVRGNKFTLLRGSEIIIGEAELKWQNFPYSDEEWEKMLVIAPEEFKDLRSKYNSVGYIPAGSSHFLLNLDGDIYAVMKPSELIYSIFHLTEYVESIAFTPSKTPYQLTKNLTYGDIAGINSYFAPYITDNTIERLVEILNDVGKDEITEGKVKSEMSIMLYTFGGREILISYDPTSETASMGFDKMTSGLYGDKDFIIKNDDLGKWFEEQYISSAEGDPFVKWDGPSHMMKYLSVEYFTGGNKTFTVLDENRSAVVKRDLSEEELTRLFAIVNSLTDECYEKGGEAGSKVVSLVEDSWTAVHFSYTPGEDTVTLTGEWETMNLTGSDKWTINSSELAGFMDSLEE